MHTFGSSSAVLLAVGLLAVPARAQGFYDDFNSLAGWKDMSLAVLWGGNTEPTSCFQIISDPLAGGGSGSNVVKMTLASKAHSGTGISGSLRTFSCIDRQLDFPVHRNLEDVVFIAEFMARWETTAEAGGSTLSNEGSRLGFSWVADYPAGGLDLTVEGQPGAKWNDRTQEWWGIPTYSFRVRTTATSGETLMQFNGGLIAPSEFETAKDGMGNFSYWLPGFISGPGGYSPSTTSPGTVNCGSIRYSQTQYRAYRHVITPTQQELYFDTTGSGMLTLIGSQSIAAATETIQLTGSGPFVDFVKNFPRIEGVRFFWRGSNNRPQALLDSIEVSVIPLLSGMLMTHGRSGPPQLVCDRDASGAVTGLDLAIFLASYAG